MKEIIFNVKLNENEYNLVMQNKSKIEKDIYSSKFFEES